MPIVLASMLWPADCFRPLSGVGGGLSGAVKGGEGEVFAMSPH
mgnify:CR=1 FL=1